MDIKLETIRNKDIKTIKQLKKELNRANSYLLRAIIELLTRDSPCFSEKQVCMLLNLNYKNFRYYLDRHGEDIKPLLNKARAYRSTIVKEKLIRKRVRRLDKTIASVDE